MQEAYLFGPFHLLVHQRELSAYGVPIPVGQRAFDILLLLVNRHGHLVTPGVQVRNGGMIVDPSSAGLAVEERAAAKHHAEPNGQRRYHATSPQ